MYVQVYLFIIRYSYWITLFNTYYTLYGLCLNICLYSVSYICENEVSYCIKELCNLSLEGPFMEEGVLPYLGMVGRFHGDDPRFVFVNPILSLLYCATRSDYPPLSTEKISLCISHLVPEIHGHKVGLI